MIITDFGEKSHRRAQKRNPPLAFFTSGGYASVRFIQNRVACGRNLAAAERLQRVGIVRFCRDDVHPRRVAPRRSRTRVDEEDGDLYR